MISGEMNALDVLRVLRIQCPRLPVLKSKNLCIRNFCFNSYLRQVVIICCADNDENFSLFSPVSNNNSQFRLMLGTIAVEGFSRF